MPAIRRLLSLASLLGALASPAWAQNLAATGPDLVPAQATPGAPPATTSPPTSATPQQSRPPGEPSGPSQSFPSRGGGYQCERSRPTS